MRTGALGLLFWLAMVAMSAASAAEAQTVEPADSGDPWASEDKPLDAAAPAAKTKASPAGKAAAAGKTGTAIKPADSKAPDKEQAPAVVDPKVLKANNWTIGLASGLPEGTFMRFGAEIARNLNDGDRLRVMPLLTNGATENITDLMYLHGVDAALTNADVLEHFRKVEKVASIERKIQYIAGMYITHLHVLVRGDIASLQDLEGKKVSFHTAGAGTSVSAPILFNRLGINVEPVYVNNALAMEMMKTGELAGLVNSGGKPVDLFTKLKNDHGFKLLSIPFDKFDDLYVPSVLTAEDYPGYIAAGEKVETLGIPVVLAVYNWPAGTDRARRLQRFVDQLVDKFAGFQQPPYHPAWRSINLAAKVPGWTRYWVAEEKLASISGGRPVRPQQSHAPAAPQPVGKHATADRQTLGK